MTDQMSHDPMSKGLPAEAARQAAARILSGPHLAILSTINRDGSPQASAIFVKSDGDDILFSTIKGRRKTVNMQRDPRVNLLVHGLPVGGEGISYATLSGTVQLADDRDGSFHQVIYDLRMGGGTPPPEPGAERLVVRLRPDRIYASPF